MELIEDFLTAHKDRNYFSRREVVDLLLDIMSVLRTSTGGAHGSIPQGTTAPDRPDSDDRELVFSGTTVKDTN